MARRTPELVYRTRLPVRLWHWINALCVFVLLMSGLMIFNAHPRLYWGKSGANSDVAWLEVGNRGPRGFVNLAGHELDTTGALGHAAGVDRAFPPWVTIPSSYNLSAAREWHFAFAWVFVTSLATFIVYSILSRHLQSALMIKWKDIHPRALWHDIRDHARLRFPRGEAARGYNPLQKIAYLSVLGGLLPLVVLTGLTMSPAMNAALPWLLDVFGGRQSARSIHFLCASGLAGFIVVHLAMVILAGPANELRSMVTGWYRLPPEDDE